MENLRDIIRENLISLRKQNGLTQIDFSKKINYSDKAVSRWEKGEVLPDVETLEKIAEIYGVELDYLFKNHKGDADLKKEEIGSLKRKNIMAVLSVFIIYTIATVTFVYLNVFYNYSFWQVFVWAVPFICLFLIYFNKISYKSKLFLMILRTILVWSFLTSLYLQFLESNLFLVFIIGAPIQACIVLAYYIKKY